MPSEEGCSLFQTVMQAARGGAHSKAHLWDNGLNASEELTNMLELRANAIANFSKDNIRTGEPLTVLEDVFVPLYFYHRFQTEAAVKLIGGMDYEYSVKGSEVVKHRSLPKQEQKQALKAVLKTLEAKTLAIPEDKLALFPPRAYGYWRSRESFKSNTGVAFDALGAAATASDMTLGLLLHPERANRLVQQKALDENNLGLDEVIEKLVSQVFSSEEGTFYETEVQRTVQYMALQHLMNLSIHSRSIPQTKAIAKGYLGEISGKIKGRSAYNQFLQMELATILSIPRKI